jgi:hypothetical protein
MRKVRDLPGVERLSQLAYPIPVWRARREQGRNRLIVDRQTALVCEGFPRSGNTFLLAAIQQLYPGARIASHLHSTAHIRYGRLLHVPTVTTLRAPLDSVASLMVFEERDDPSILLRRWWTFYSDRALRVPSNRVVRFDELIADPRAVVTVMADGLGWPPSVVELSTELAFDKVSQLAHRRFGAAASSKNSLPSEARTAATKRARQRVRDGEPELLRRCENLYGELATR